MKILSLHGGGMLGYITLCYLEKLEKETGKLASELFDLIGGVSTGSTITAGYVCGMSANQMKKMYKELHPAIFGSKRNIIMSLFKAPYDMKNLEKTLIEQYGETKLSDSHVDAMIYAVALNDGDTLKTKFWKSWRDDVELYKMCCASSAAPSLFKPYEIDGIHYTDGGVATNNPTMCLVAEALRRGTPPNEIEVVSLWTDNGRSYANPSKLQGYIQLIMNIGTLFVKSGEDIVDYQADKICKTMIEVAPEINLSIDTDEFDLLEQAALLEWAENGEEVLKLFQ